MAFLDFLRPKDKREESLFDSYLSLQSQDLFIKEFLIEHGIDLIAKTISKSEIEVFRKNKKTNEIENTLDDIYYLLNIRPNANEDGTKFIYNAVRKLFIEGEALIVKLPNDTIYLADSWDKDDRVIAGKVYRKVKITNEELQSYTLTDTFYSDDVVYLSLGDSKISELLNNYHTQYASMVNSAAQGYKSSKATKYRLTPRSANQPIQNAETGEKISYNDFKDQIADGLLKPESTVSMISDNFNLEVLKNEASKTNPDEYIVLAKEFGDKVAMTFNIPLDVFYGTQTDKSNSANDYITFAVSWILELFEDGFNGKFISKESFLQGERIKFNNSTFKHFDIMDVANSLDKLFAIGWSHNDLKKILGQPKINEKWADRHHVTKNYMDVETPMEGGE